MKLLGLTLLFILAGCGRTANHKRFVSEVLPNGETVTKMETLEDLDKHIANIEAELAASHAKRDAAIQAEREASMRRAKLITRTVAAICALAAIVFVGLWIWLKTR